MKCVMINSCYYTLVDFKDLTSEMYKIHYKLAVKLDDNMIYPIARNYNEPGLLLRENSLFTQFTQVPYTIGEIVEIPASTSVSIKDIIKENEASRDLTYEQISTTTTDNIYKPPISGNESAEMRMLKESIIAKNIDINKYEDRFNGKFQNDKRLLNKDSISLDKLKNIADALDLEVIMTIKDKPGNIPNPMNTEFSGIITEEVEE